MLENLSQTISRKRASDLLHSMAASKDILFWTPCGQLLRNQRIIPVRNISELVEYVLLLHNDDIVKPCALKTFIDGLAELGINKRLIQNKRILAELLEKDSITRQALTWNPQGKRKRGRPRNSWRRNTEAELKQQGTNWTGAARTAQNRVRWRRVVDGLCSIGSDGPK